MHNRAIIVVYMNGIVREKITYSLSDNSSDIVSSFPILVGWCAMVCRCAMWLTFLRATRILLASTGLRAVLMASITLEGGTL